MVTNTRIDWEAAYRFYCTPDNQGHLPSYQNVASYFNCSVSAVESRAAKELWGERRANVQENETKTFEEARQTRIDDAANRHITAAQKAQEMAMQVMESLGSKPGSSREILATVQALGKAIDMERIALGLPTEVQKAEITEHWHNGHDSSTLTDEDIAQADAIWQRNQTALIESTIAKLNKPDITAQEVQEHIKPKAFA